MTINAELKAQTLPEFVTLAKQMPSKLAFASSGNGGAPHMAGELTHLAEQFPLWQRIRSSLFPK